MKALTISQPYASHIANGHKWVENRTWSTPYRGQLAIHAGKGTQYMTHADMKAIGMPFGCIVAVAEIVHCMKRSTIEEIAGIRTKAGTENEKVSNLGNRSWHDASVHRHAEGPVCWILANAWKLPEPIPYRGAQGLWNVPQEIIAQMRQQQDSEARAVLEANRIR